jgi:hypothetical protein
MNANEELRCRHCDDVIGVYEPIVVVRDGIPVCTSRAAAESGQLSGKRCFHADCFAAGGPPADVEDR